MSDANRLWYLEANSGGTPWTSVFLVDVLYGKYLMFIINFILLAIKYNEYIKWCFIISVLHLHTICEVRAYIYNWHLCRNFTACYCSSWNGKMLFLLQKVLQYDITNLYTCIICIIRYFYNFHCMTSNNEVHYKIHNCQHVRSTHGIA
jgi:hypothetical protein